MHATRVSQGRKGLTMKATIIKNAMHIKYFLEHVGYRILEGNWSHSNDRINVIANEDGNLVFDSCNVTHNDGCDVQDDELDLEALKQLAIAYLAEHDASEDVRVRFDAMGTNVFGERRALTWLYHNALSVLRQTSAALTSDPGH